MSRRHHGRPRQHDRPGPDATGTAGTMDPRAVDLQQETMTPPSAPARPVDDGPPTVRAAATDVVAAGASVQIGSSGPAQLAQTTPVRVAPDPAGPPSRPPVMGQAPQGSPSQGQMPPVMGQAPQGQASQSQATAPQLRRFIKSRPYVPMHELRRRFAIEGGDDDVTAVHIDRHWIFVGLPEREGGLLGELLRAGEIGYELSLDPRSPIVVGVYPMRPAPRP
jgi:hypothetical protein